jgi:hypothetical protein
VSIQRGRFEHIMPPTQKIKLMMGWLKLCTNRNDGRFSNASAQSGAGPEDRRKVARHVEAKQARHIKDNEDSGWHEQQFGVLEEWQGYNKTSASFNKYEPQWHEIATHHCTLRRL